MSYSYDRQATAQYRVANTALYGHTDMTSAYIVEDYPYGRSLRCRIRYWLEFKPKKGFRFISQTENPKTLRWNKPKASTYALLGGNMCIDGRGHVTWDAITEYSRDEEVLEFVRKYPRTDMTVLKIFVPKKIKYLEASAEGRVVFKINGVPQPPSEDDMGRSRKELDTWIAISKLVH